MTGGQARSATGVRPRARARARAPATAASWVIVGATVLLCFAIIPGMRDNTRDTLVKRGLVTIEDSEDISCGSLLHIPYEQMFDATPPALRPLCLAFFVLVLLFLFSSISITASDFFCPNLATMAAYLGLSETTAGVTLLAFGNGSPDVFSTFIAMREDTFGLAAGELIGAASFITSIVVGSIAMVKPFHVPRYAFIRDVSFFLVAVLLFMWALADGHLTLRESGSMIGLYALYVAVVIGGNWWQRRQRRREEYAQLGWKTMSRDEEQATAPPDPVADAQLVPPPVSPSLAPPHFVGRFGRRASSASLHMQTIPTDSPDIINPMSHSAHAHYDDDDTETPRAGFSLLGAVEFRDVVNALKQSGELPSPSGSSRHHSRPVSPLRSPMLEPSEPDYFHSHRAKHQRHSSMQGLAAVERRVSMTRSRSGSLHPAWTGRSRQSTLEPESPLLPVPASPNLGVDANGEHIPMSSSPRNKHNLSLEIQPHALSTVVASETSSTRATSETPTADVPQIALQNEDGEAANPFPLSRSTTIEVARRSYNKMKVVLHTLFPSLQGFRHKSFLGMGLAVLSVPAIFALTLTLPVIDDGRGDEGGVLLPGAEDEPLADATTPDEHDDDDDTLDRRRGHDISAGLHHLVESGYPSRHQSQDEDGESSCSACSTDDDCMVFNPALTAAQCVFGPIVCGYLVFQDESYLRWVLLGGGVCGLMAAAAVLKFATDGTGQPWRVIRCCCGFICSMVWIASIADEVVAVLSTFGEIFGLSNAIIGLTIFAVGNSLADLVANVTIAQFSPNMAYAACFGGPMLNLLLGVGGSGTYMVLFGRPHVPVALDFSPTLWVSATGLVLVLATTAIIVPLNRYLIDRRWALCLLIAYATLMTVNVIVEIRSEKRGGEKGQA